MARYGLYLGNKLGGSSVIDTDNIKTKSISDFKITEGNIHTEYENKMNDTWTYKYPTNSMDISDLSDHSLIVLNSYVSEVNVFYTTANNVMYNLNLSSFLSNNNSGYEGGKIATSITETGYEENNVNGNNKFRNIFIMNEVLSGINTNYKYINTFIEIDILFDRDIIFREDLVIIQENKTSIVTMKR